MLEYLHITNLALIEDVSLELCPGMNALTGETGAGKSFILKALSFLLGDRLKADMVRPGAERAVVEGQFQTDDGELILRRELLAESGRSRVFMNNALHTQDILKELRPKLITYTSQHAQQQLMQPNFQARLIESHFSKPELLEERDMILEQLKAVALKQEELQKKQQTILEKRDLLEMQSQEIAKVAPEEGEEERLENLRQQARDRQQIVKTYDAGRKLLYGRETGLYDVLAALEKQLGVLTDIDDSFAVYTAACLDFRANLDALAQRLDDPPEADEDMDINGIEERLFALAQLKRKLHRTLPEICALQKELEDSLSFLDSCALDIRQLAKEEAKLKERLSDVLDRIRPLRRTTAETFCQALEEQLRDLAFSEHVRVIPEFQPQPLWKDIADERVRFLWAPNPGQTPKPLDHIASGGELSRFLLALTSLQTKDDTSTYIFDEVDAGVGGFTLGKLAEKLVELAKSHQILLITHWPQLAANAKRHFQITKTVTGNTTSTNCTLLDAAARKAELARMAGGADFAACLN